MDTANMVWISVCFPVEYEQSVDGVWKWKYARNGKGKTTPILVAKTISYVELYDKIKEVLNVDTRVYKMEISAVVPIMSKAPAAPTIIDSDNNVKWFLSVCKETFLCVTVSNEVEIEEDLGDEGCFPLIEGGEQIANKNSEEQHVQTDDDGHHDNFVEIFVDCNDFNVSEDSPQRIDGDHNSPISDDNHVELSMEEPCSWNVVHDNDVECSRIVSANASSLYGGTSVRIPENEDMQVNQLFTSKHDLILKLQLLAVKCHFEYRVKKSNKSTYTVICIDENCKWRLRATKIAESHIFEVRKYNGHHSCSMSIRRRDHRHASYMIIGNHIASKYQDANRVYRPRDIINDIRREFGITLSYTKAYMAKHFACGLIRGKPLESYVKLPAYCHVMEMQNPGTLTFIHTTEDRRFKYFFMALGPSIRGFLNSMRRVISVDGTFLKSRMKGTLLVATCQDANFQIFPLAWGVVDSKNDASWTWFFQKLRLITGDTDELVIISDRATCIKNGVRNVFQLAHHGNCTYHLQKNLKTNFPRSDLATLFRAASEAYTITEFESNMAALCSKKKGIKEYLLEEDFHYWARAHFTRIRYNIMTTNNAESLNGLLKSAREFPIVGLLEYIRETLQRWFYERHVESGKCVTHLTPPLEKKMCMIYNESNGLEVNQVSPEIYQVGDILEHHFVDLDEKTCTCRKFDLDKFPCAHAIAVVRFKGDDGYNLCSHFYTTICWRQAYSSFVCPLPNEVEWRIPEHVMAREVFPPLARRQGGRPSKKRKRSAGETRALRKCSRCKKTGHIRSTCTGQAAGTET